MSSVNVSQLRETVFHKHIQERRDFSSPTAHSPQMRERASPTNMIDEFIDICNAHNIPEEVIQKHVMTMIAAMQDALSLQAENERLEKERKLELIEQRQLSLFGESLQTTNDNSQNYSATASPFNNDRKTRNNDDTPRSIRDTMQNVKTPVSVQTSPRNASAVVTTQTEPSAFAVPSPAGQVNTGRPLLNNSGKGNASFVRETKSSMARLRTGWVNRHKHDPWQPPGTSTVAIPEHAGVLGAIEKQTASARHNNAVLKHGTRVLLNRARKGGRKDPYERQYELDCSTSPLEETRRLSFPPRDRAEERLASAPRGDRHVAKKTYCTPEPKTTFPAPSVSLEDYADGTPSPSPRPGEGRRESEGSQNTGAAAPTFHIPRNTVGSKDRPSVLDEIAATPPSNRNDTVRDGGSYVTSATSPACERYLASAADLIKKSRTFLERHAVTRNSEPADRRSSPVTSTALPSVSVSSATSSMPPPDSARDIEF